MSDEAEPPSEPAEQDYAFILRPEKSPYWSTRGLKLDLGADRWAADAHDALVVLDEVWADRRQRP